MRRPSSNRIREYAIAGVLSLALVWLLFLNWGILHKEEIARQAARSTKAELVALTARQQSLQATISDLATSRGQESQLRQTYGVAKPGEEVIIVVPPAATTTPPKLTWYQKIFDWFGF